MKRDKTLIDLSRDHQHALAVALELKRATAETAAAARATFASFWEAEGARHFRIEEEILLPAFARRRSPEHEAVVQVLVEHVDIRRRASDLQRADVPVAADLHALGERLDRHIRHEERVLFPLIEQALAPADLTELAAALEEAELAP
jgi:iron-sulfur cluster repair protein YtfE (RIC family)